MKRFKRLLAVVSTGIISLSSLFVLAPAVHAATDTCIWTGTANSNFNDGGNWSNCDNSNVPEAGDTVEFPADVTNRNVTVNVPLTVASITFGGNAATNCGSAGYNISGVSALTVTGVIGFNHTGVCATGMSQTITAPLVVGGNVVVDATGASMAEALDLSDSTVTSTGNLFARNSLLKVGDVDQTVTLGVENNGELEYNVSSCTNATINSQVSLANNAKIIVKDNSGPCDEFTINNVALGLSSALDADYAEVTIGTLTGTPSYELTVPDGSATKINVNSSVIEGDYADVSYSANSPGSSLNISEKVHANVSGVYGTTLVRSLAYLKGTGTVGNLSVSSGAFLAPGNSPGCLNSGNLTLAGTYQVEVQGGTACSGYDQMNVTGTVDVTGATLSLATTNFVPTTGQKFVIINNDGSDAVTGTFNSLAEGATIVDGGVTYTISYVGGDGNDVELTVTAVNAADIPGAPNTGFALLTANPLLTLLGSLIAAAGFGLLARRQLNK